LLILTFLVAAGTLVQDFRFDRSLAREHAAAAATDREFAALDVALVSFGAAQTSYVATGQDSSFWLTHAAELAAQIEAGINRLRSASTSADARVRYDAAVGALADLNRVDGRARELVRKDQRFGASDLIFLDAVDASERLAAELTAARTAERQASDLRVTSTARLRLGVNGLALGFLLIVALFFWRMAGRAIAESRAGIALTRPLQLDLEAEPEPAPERPTSPARPPAPSVPINVDLAPQTDLNLVAAAELCVDLARVVDGRDVPGLVERAATVLDAKGLIVWVADASGAMLRPALTHGYSDKVLSRLGALSIDADNVTSLAFRSMRTQMMAGAQPGDPGAIAAPLITPAGCVGVLAAEVHHTNPDKARLSVARMIAAQFATIIPGTDAVGARAAGAN
jgi:hypothetical protein